MSIYDGVMVATASAGTGKTTALIARLLGWSLGEGWDRSASALSSHQSEWGEWAAEDVAGRVLSRVVCITFTEKAAAQMVEKFSEGLLVLLEGRSLPGLEPELLPGDEAVLKQRIEALTACQDQLNLTTIHSFCRGILARHPLEAGLHPGFVIDADQRILEETTREVVEEAVRESLESEGNHPVIELLLTGINPTDIAQCLHRLVLSGVPPEVFNRNPFPTAQVADFVDRMLSNLASLRRIGEARFVAGRLGSAKNAIAWCEGFHGFLPVHAKELEVLTEAARYVHDDLEKTVRDRFRKWHKGEFTATELKALAEDVDDFQAHASALFDALTRLKTVDVDLIRLSHRALGPLLTVLLERLRVAGVVTFPQLLTATARLLTNHPTTVCAKERKRLDQLMVDEFQDTDEEQCSIIRTLALRGDPKTRPGLFLVGDPKQSIYGWRSADLTTYTRFLQEVFRDHQAKKHALSTNWRSCPEVIAEVNRVFAKVMVEDEGFQPAYEALELPPAGGQQFQVKGGTWAPVEYWCSWDWSHETSSPILNASSDRVSALEAECVAQDLLHLRAQGALDSWSDAMILFRTSSALDKTLRGLREAGIPYAVERDRNYYRRREIIESAALVRCVLDPMDQVALVTLLRSALVGVPDAAWIPLWRGSLPGLFSRLRTSDSSHIDTIAALGAEVADSLKGKVAGLERIEGWQHALTSTAQRLGHLRASLKHHPPARFVQELRHLFAVESVEGARFLGAYRVANLERFFRALTELLENHGADRARVVRELRTLVTKQMDAEEAKPLESSQDAVRVMTIHKSKGLKARHVYMMGLHRAKGNPMVFQTLGEKTRATNRVGDWAFRLFGKTTLGFQDVVDLEALIERSESLRTLYVGMTRATERLVLLGQWPNPGRGKGKAAAQSHLEPLQACVDVLPQVVEAFSECAASDRSHVDIGGQRWVFPVLKPQIASNSAQGVLAELPSLNEVERSLAETVVRRSEALAHQRRPLGEAVTTIQESELHWEEGDISGGGDALIAALSGTAVHGFMEHFESLNNESTELVEALLRKEVGKVLGGLELSDDEKSTVFDRAHRCVQRFMSASLCEEFRELQPKIVARELSLLLPVEGDENALSYVSGTLDLMYRDPVDGAYVIVDFKTDEVDEESAIRRAPKYGVQGEIYRRAVDLALPNDRPSRFELWFLYAGTRVPIRPRQ